MKRAMILSVAVQSIDLISIENGILLDRELQEAYYENMLLHSRMTGEFFVFKKGNTAVGRSGCAVFSAHGTVRWDFL